MRWTRSAVSALLADRGLRPRKSLGQSFLVDENFLDALARDTGAGPGDAVVEIGSGLGNLTDKLAARAGHVWAFEVDPRLHELSKELLAGRDNVTLLNRDGREWEAHVDPSRPRALRVVSNLPYSGWQPLVLRLLTTPLAVASYTFMVQRDVWERLRARPATKDYGPMPVLLQAACEVRMLRRAGKGLFHPVPRVESVVLDLRRTDPSLDFEKAEARLRALFAHRRKKSPAAGGRRVEQLPPEELLRLVAGANGADLTDV